MLFCNTAGFLTSKIDRGREETNEAIVLCVGRLDPWREYESPRHGPERIREPCLLKDEGVKVGCEGRGVPRSNSGVSSASSGRVADELYSHPPIKATQAGEDERKHPPQK